MSLDKQKGARDAGKREAAQTEQPIIGEYTSSESKRARASRKPWQSSGRSLPTS